MNIIKRATYIAAGVAAVSPLSALAHAGHGYEAVGTESITHYAFSPLHYIASFISIAVVITVGLAVVNRIAHRTITQPAKGMRKPIDTVLGDLEHGRKD